MIEPRLCRRSFRVKIQGSKPEKSGFHLASCNMQLLANYTKYYTVAIFTRKSLIYMGFLGAWILLIRRSLVRAQVEEPTNTGLICPF
jgi:hypothetical protein